MSTCALSSPLSELFSNLALTLMSACIKGVRARSAAHAHTQFAEIPKRGRRFMFIDVWLCYVRTVLKTQNSAELGLGLTLNCYC